MSRTETIQEMFDYLVSISNNLVITCGDVYTKFEAQFPDWESLFDPILPDTKLPEFIQLQKIKPRSSIYEEIPILTPGTTEFICAIDMCGGFDATQFNIYLGDSTVCSRNFIDQAFNDWDTKPKRTASLLALIIYGLRGLPKRYFTATPSYKRGSIYPESQYAVFYTMIDPKKQLHGVESKAAVLLDTMKSRNASEIFNVAFGVDYQWNDFEVFGKLNTKSRGDDALRALASFINHINADPELVSLFAELSTLRDTAFNKRLWLRCLEVALRKPRHKYSFWQDVEPDTIEAAIEILKKQISQPPKTKKR